MSKSLDKNVYCVIDANLNRAKEGLRVCEDTARFILKDATLAKKTKRLRHDITRALKGSPICAGSILKSRDSNNDIGKKPDLLEKRRKNTTDIFLSNFQRAKEAVRVLEEFFKLINTKISDRFKKIRFRIYSLEKETSKEF